MVVTGAVLATGGTALGAVLGGVGGAAIGGACGLLAPVLMDLAVRLAEPPRTRRTEDDARSAAEARGSPFRQGTGILPAPIGLMEHPLRGREAITRDLLAAASERRESLHVVTGMGGVGKTAVAIEVARRFRDEGRRVWWLTANDHTEIETEMLELARALGASRGQVEGARRAERNPMDLVWAVLESVSNWVLVLNNIDDPTVLARSGHQLAEGNGWLRPSSKGFVLVTSRQRDRTIWGGATRVHDLDVVSALAAQEILLDLAPNTSDPEVALTVAARLGFLPLALRLAGMYLADPLTSAKTFREYLDELERHFSELMKDVGGAGREDRRRAVITTWELSLESLTERGLPFARELLGLLACYAPTSPLPLDVLDPAVIAEHGVVPNDTPEQAVRAALRGLVSLGLITISHRSHHADWPHEALTMHPLVAETQRRRTGRALGTADAVRSAAVALFAQATSRLEPKHAGDWPRWLVLAPHVRALLGQLGTSAELTREAIQVSNRVCDALNESGHYSSAHMLSQMSVEACRAALSEENEQVLVCRHLLARSLLNLGKAQAAEQAFRSLLALRRRLLGDDHSHTLATRHGLARALLSDWKLAGAETEFREVLDARRRLLGEDHPHTIATRHYLAWALLRRWELPTAESEFRTVLQARHRLLGDDHPHTLETQHGLAWVLLRKWELPAAEAEWLQVLDKRRAILGEQHPDTLDTRHGLARLLLRRGRLAIATEELHTLLDASRSSLGDQHPHTLDVRHNLARTLLERGAIAEAEHELRTILPARRELLGDSHPHTLATRHALARVAFERGELEDAEAELRRLVHERSAVLGADHPDVLDSRHELARAILARGDRTTAEAEFRAVLQARQRSLGARHPDTIATLRSIELAAGNPRWRRWIRREQ
ncbi:FxSxx-COOH system tetratricopeptide repeat protein [Actinomadura rudentiformis]|uniref:Tetratricopeptide repeat protein n=1 Tax=Actinomadura rudentiformis TaxID=359158 RepID=A0A6H9YTL4_9ACTN|nr:FxSxx-COOH system tetratricopeptide repeat protein [Actinomadura rudentiformis]KAB2343753.1 tetratricopeptide repeat protein [Actinomadura rudentiformis]